MKIIGIIGTRSRNTEGDFVKVRAIFKKVYEEGDWICSGGCPQGGDNFAHDIARKEGIPILIFYPDWNKYGKGAGFVRNGLIAEKSDILIACVAEDRKGGTEDTIKKFKKFHPDATMVAVFQPDWISSGWVEGSWNVNNKIILC